MSSKFIVPLLMAVLIVPAAFGWEYTATFDTTNEGWKYFDDDTGPGTAAPDPSGGVLYVPAPFYAGTSWRYVFFDQDATNPNITANMDFSQGGYVQATLSYTGKAPKYAFFFLAGGGTDDIIYIDGAQGGSQTFWAAVDNPFAVSTDFTTTARFDLTPDTFGVFNVGMIHDSRRGTPDSWENTITSVDAFGIVLGYSGNPGESTFNIDEFTVTPEPSFLLLSGPLAGFLGWKIRRKSRRSAAKA